MGVLSTHTLDRLRYGLGSPIASDEIEQGLGLSAGNVYYVSSTASNEQDSLTQPGTRDRPFATLDYAIGRCTASQGDTIVLMPGHAETTTNIALDVAGIRIIGLGYGRNRPTLTATTGASDLISVTGANCEMHNVRLVGAASGCTALLNIAAADFYAYKPVFEHGAAPLFAVTVTAAGDRFILEDPQFRGTAAGPDICVEIEGKCDDWKIIRPRADYGKSSGLDIAFLRSSFKMQGYEIIEPIIVGFDALVIDINSSVLAVGDGVLIGGGSVGSGALTIANVHDVGGCAIIEHRVTDAVTAKGLVVPTATPD